MKSILFRGIGVSLFSLCLTFSTFADGEMTTGSKTGKGNGSGFAPNTTIESNATAGDAIDFNEIETGFLNWLTEFLAAF